MAAENQYLADVEAILSHRHDNGADLWTTPDKRLIKGSPFYDKAKKDARFLEAFDALKAKTVDGQIVVERVVPKLARLSFCEKGKQSALATKRYGDIVHNMNLNS